MGTAKKVLNHYGISRMLKLKPSYLFYSPTLKCPSRCIHCRIWDSGKKDKYYGELSAQEIKEMLADPFLNNIRHVWLTGGEPLVRADIIDVIAAFIDGLGNLETLCIATSGMLPKKVAEIMAFFHERQEKSSKMPYLWFHISLDGPNPEIHDKIRGVKGAFRRLEETAQVISDKKADLSAGLAFNCVIQPANINHLDEVETYARERSIPLAFNIVEVSEDNYYRNQYPGNDLTLSNKDKHSASNFLEKLAARSDEYHSAHYSNLAKMLGNGVRTRKCVTIEETIYIDPNGSAFACPRAYSIERHNVVNVGAQKAHRAMLNAKPRIQKEFCPTCPLGCSFGEGLSLSEAIRVGLK